MSKEISLEELREARLPYEFHFGGQPGDRCACCQCKLITAIDKVLDTPPPTGEVGEALRLLEFIETSGSFNGISLAAQQAKQILRNLRPSLSHPEEIELFGMDFIRTEWDEELVRDGWVIRHPNRRIIKVTHCDSSEFKGYFRASENAGAALYRLKPVEPVVIEWETEVNESGSCCSGSGLFYKEQAFGKRFKVTAVEIMEEE